MIVARQMTSISPDTMLIRLKEVVHNLLMSDVSIIDSTGNAGDSIGSSLTGVRSILPSTGNAGELVLSLAFSGFTLKGIAWLEVMGLRLVKPFEDLFFERTMVI